MAVAIDAINCTINFAVSFFVIILNFKFNKKLVRRGEKLEKCTVGALVALLAILSPLFNLPYLTGHPHGLLQRMS